MNPDARIYVAGHAGMVGSALVRMLGAQGYTRIITVPRESLDLLDQAAVAAFFESEKPEYVFLAAGKTGGIHANNTYRADFIYENVVMQSNVIHQSFLHEVEKLMFYACSCIYPKHLPAAAREEDILCGPLESTNEPFAMAKIAGLKMCESYNRQYGTDFITIIPTNLYGPNQRYEPMNSLVVPSLIQKFHQAKTLGQEQVTLWGSGRPSRDFLYVDDLADASIYLMQDMQGDVVLNVGTGQEQTISEVADIVQMEIGYEGEVTYDPSQPDGVLRKLQDVSKINDLGWKHRVGMSEGIGLSYRDFLERVEGGARIDQPD